MNINLHLNLSEDALAKKLKKLPVSEYIKNKITVPNSRVEFIEEEDFLFMIFYIPEYNPKRKSIDSVEINILVDLKDKQIELFANNSSYFFEKYKQEIAAISVKSFGSFFEEFLSLVFEDVSRIINHILHDINEIRKEYADRADNYKVIRHLTNAQLNISSINLIFANQDKLIELVNTYVSKTLQTALNYKKTYLEDELKYAKDFCGNVMQSINTKYSVRTSDDMYRFNKYSSIIVVSNFFMAMLFLFRDNTKAQTPEYIYMSIVLILCAALIITVFFRNKK